MDKLLKIGIPIMIVLLMLLVVGTGLVLARGTGTSALTTPTASYAGYSSGTWVGCGGYCTGTGAGCGQGGLYGGNSGSYPPCHSY
ncbi:MAG TPA: hypothetical protein VF366_05460 [Dehalococcoidia bacterium]